MSSQSSGSFYTPFTSPTPTNTSGTGMAGLPATPVIPRKIRRPSAHEVGSSNGLLDVMYRSISPSNNPSESTSTGEGVHMSASVARAGFLHAVHAHSMSSATSIPRVSSSHQQSSIRERTMALAQSVGSLHTDSPTPGSLSLSLSLSTPHTPAYPFPDMTNPSSSGQPLDSIQETPTPRATSPLRTPVSSYQHSHSPGERGRPSALSLMIARARSESTATKNDDVTTPVVERPSPPAASPRPLSDIPERTPTPHERTPLLDPESLLNSTPTKRPIASTPTLRQNLPSPKLVISSTLSTLPSVLLGSLLNILDALSYGMLLFPSSGLFSSPALSLGPAGVSLFFVSALTSQLVYAAGGSSFAGANGSMMIEVVPFFHILANQIADALGEEDVRGVIATTLSAYALSSILTGLAFLLLGYLRMGRLVGFFPRHILVGCIGGIGVFLILTGLRVATRLADDDPLLSVDTIKFLFSGDAIARWLPAVVLAIGARVLTSRVQSQLAFPGYMLFIPLLFYALVLIFRLNLSSLRQDGWIFDAPGSGAWYVVYAHFSLRHTSWRVIGQTMPTQLALLFFNVLHPPLNVPALAVSLGKDDIDVDAELRGHAWSNLLSGACGSVPNYLVYVNTLLFVRVGGGTKLAGWMLALANVGLLVMGTSPVRYIPVLVVSALIFVLGLDLVKEAVWDCRRRVSRSEYVTVWVIVGVMTMWDFVVGVLVGVVVSCVFFVVQNSRRAAIRAVYSGEQALSTVRRPGAHRAYLRAVGAGTVVLRLQGFLFFGTIAAVEDAVRALVNRGAEGGIGVRFVILDLALVGGVDMSAAEAFVRVQRLCSSRGVVLCFAGASGDGDYPTDGGGEHGRSQVQSAVEGVPGAEVFGDVNGAMEWAENVWLREWYDAQKELAGAEAIVLPGREPLVSKDLADVGATPRRTLVHDVGRRTIGGQDGFATSVEVVSPARVVEPEHAEALSALQRALSAYGSKALDGAYFAPLLARLERLVLPAGTILFAQGSQPEDGLYILAAGVLRATYAFPHGGMKNGSGGDVVEAMVPGAIAGELSALAGEPRNATVSVDVEAVVWKLSARAMGELKEREPGVWEAFVRMVLKSAKVDYDMLLSALAARQ